MKKYILWLILLLFWLNAKSQKNIHEAYIGKKVNWEEYIKQNPPLRDFTGELSVIPFNQCDDNWNEDIMAVCSNNDTNTICSDGCAVSCMAMLLHANGQNVNPPLLNNYIKEENGYDPCSILKWNIACNYASSTVIYSGYDYFSLDKIKTCLNSRNPVIISVKAGHHFVIITGYKEGGNNIEDFTILDPNGGKERKLSCYSDDCTSGGLILRLFSGVNAPCINQSIPSHCSNCLWEPEYGEIDEDCGGECPPCEDSDYNKGIVNDLVLPNEIIAINDILIEPENDQEINFINKKSIKCSNQIILKNNTNFFYGSDISLKITQNRNELTRDCSDPCIFVPNATGYDKLYVRTTNIEYIDFTLINQWGTTIKEFHQSINCDGLIALFSSPSNGTYFFVSEFHACNGDVIPYQGSIYFCNKKSDISNKDSLLFVSNNIKLYEQKISIVPNPTNGIMKVNFPKLAINTYDIKIFDLMGNIVYSKDYINQEQNINISNLPKGIYFIKIFYDNKILVEKIIKN